MAESLADAAQFAAEAGVKSRSTFRKVQPCSSLWPPSPTDARNGRKSAAATVWWLPGGRLSGFRDYGDTAGAGAIRVSAVSGTGMRVHPAAAGHSGGPWRQPVVMTGLSGAVQRSPGQFAGVCLSRAHGQRDDRMVGGCGFARMRRWFRDHPVRHLTSIRMHRSQAASSCSASWRGVPLSSAITDRR